MKGMFIAIFAIASITPVFGNEVIPLTEFTREDEVYIQRGWNELQGECAIRAIHEVFDYEMETEYELRITDDYIAVVRGWDGVGVYCTSESFVEVRKNQEGQLQHNFIKHEDMCYAKNSC